MLRLGLYLGLGLGLSLGRDRIGFRCTNPRNDSCAIGLIEGRLALLSILIYG